MNTITIERDESGGQIVAARSEWAEGRVVLRDGMAVFLGDFARNPLPAGVLGLLEEAVHAAKQHAAVRPVPATATFTARIVTGDSTKPDDYVPTFAAADIVITADGSDGTPVATYPLSTNPFDIFGGDPKEVLAQHGWEMLEPGELDEYDYLIASVRRIPEVGA